MQGKTYRHDQGLDLGFVVQRFVINVNMSIVITLKTAENV